MQSKPSVYRRLAEVCRRNAKATDGHDRARWLRMAHAWMLLVRDAAGANDLTATARAVAPACLERRADTPTLQA